MRPVKSYRTVPGTNSFLHLHRWRAQQALGRPLPPNAIVHHADGTRSDDGPLVICPDQAYHMELHRKMRVKAAGGNPWTDWMCTNCGPIPLVDFVQARNLCKKCTRESHNLYYATHPSYRQRACARAKRQREAALATV